MGYNVDPDLIKVVLTRVNDGKMWYFSKSHNDGSFCISNGLCGQTGCIIFRPHSLAVNDGGRYNEDDYYEGDVFNVNITGLDKGDVSYTVKFFSLNGTYIEEPSQTKEPIQTKEPVANKNSNGDNTHATDPVYKGLNITDSKTKAVYKVTNAGSGKVALTDLTSSGRKQKKLVVPAAINYKGVKLKVTSIKAYAFLGNHKVTKITIGSNVTSISSKAFLGCTKLKKIILKPHDSLLRKKVRKAAKKYQVK